MWMALDNTLHNQELCLQGDALETLMAVFLFRDVSPAKPVPLIGLLMLNAPVDNRLAYIQRSWNDADQRYPETRGMKVIGPLTAANRLTKCEASNGGHVILSLSTCHV